MYKQTKYLAAGDRALVMEFGTPSEEINRKIRSMECDRKVPNGRHSETVPTYRSLMIHYDPIMDTMPFRQARSLEEQSNRPAVTRTYEIPTLYGGEFGPDIENVAKHNNLTVEQVIEIHTSRDYLIYMLGFTPGFPYLGGMDERIATPRLSTPRTKINAGSVGIAANQTGVYPIESPGGWQLIGRTPLKL